MSDSDDDGDWSSNGSEVMVVDIYAYLGRFRVGFLWCSEGDTACCVYWPSLWCVPDLSSVGAFEEGKDVLQ
jgi:hypothetical protein